VRRQPRFVGLPLADDQRVGLFAQPVQFRRAPGRQPVAALEPQRHAQIEQLQDSQKAAGVLADLLKQVEEPIAAAHFLVERRDQRARIPDAGAAPGRVEHDVVEARAQRIMRRAQQLDRHTRRARVLLEGAHRLDRALAQLPRIGLGHGVAQARHQLQQRRRRSDQRVDAHHQAFDILARCRLDLRRGRRRRRR